MRKAMILLVAILMLGVIAVAAQTISFAGGIINLERVRLESMNIWPAAPRDTLIEALNDSAFELDEDGNLTLPNTFWFGNPHTRDVNENSRNLTRGTALIPATILTSPYAWPNTEICEVVEPSADAATCTLEVSANSILIRLFDENGGAVPASTFFSPAVGVAWSVITSEYPIDYQPSQAIISADNVVWDTGTACVIAGGQWVNHGITNPTGASCAIKRGTGINWDVDGPLSCGIVRNPLVPEWVDWKLGSIDIDRTENFFAFVTDRSSGVYLNNEWLDDPSASLGNVYCEGVEVSWFVWRVDE